MAAVEERELLQHVAAVYLRMCEREGGGERGREGANEGGRGRVQM